MPRNWERKGEKFRKGFFLYFHLVLFSEGGKERRRTSLRCSRIVPRMGLVCGEKPQEEGGGGSTSSLTLCSVARVRRGKIEKEEKSSYECVVCPGGRKRRKPLFPYKLESGRRGEKKKKRKKRKGGAATPISLFNVEKEASKKRGVVTLCNSVCIQHTRVKKAGREERPDTGPHFQARHRKWERRELRYHLLRRYAKRKKKKEGPPFRSLKKGGRRREADPRCDRPRRKGEKKK